MRDSSSFPFRNLVSKLVGAAAAASMVGGCASVQLGEPVYTGSTSNQQQIIAGKSGASAGGQGGRLLASGGSSVQSQPLPPVGQSAGKAESPTQVAGAKPTGYTPPAPYAARGLPQPVGPVASTGAKPSSPKGSQTVASLEPKSLNRQAAEIAASNAVSAYTVQPGDTLWGISQRHNVTAEALLAANNLRGSEIQAGQRLQIPSAGSGAGRAVQVASVDPKIAADNYRVSSQQVADPGIAPQARPETNGSVAVAARTPPRPSAVDISGGAKGGTPSSYTPPNQLPEKQEASGGGFRWPVRGKVISSFGKKPNGERNDGINFAVPEGTSVKATEAGTVIYSGNELKSYGNLILIKHADGWVSAYAHNSKLLVKRGDKVRRGQIVAESGMTGGVSSPQLHFELRKGANPVNPLDHLADA